MADGSSMLSRASLASVPLTLRLPDVPYRRLHFELTSRSTALLSDFKGSMLRGAFGHALRKAVCAMGSQQPCDTCTLRAVCVHSRLFETFIEGPPPPFFKGLSKAPRPYVIEVDRAGREFSPGDSLPFDLLLLGHAIPHEPYARLAVERMAKEGLGVGKAPFELTSFSAENGNTLRGASFTDDAERVRLRFLTPTRIKVHGQLVANPTPRQLVFQMVRRVLELAAFHVPDAKVDWQFHPLLDHADTLTVESSHLEWRDWRRFSNRQQTDMLLGGFVGEMTLAGDLAPLLPLFRAVEVLHVGKGTTFGLGMVEMEQGRAGPCPPASPKA